MWPDEALNGREQLVKPICNQSSSGADSLGTESSKVCDKVLDAMLGLDRAHRAVSTDSHIALFSISGAEARNIRASGKVSGGRGRERERERRLQRLGDRGWGVGHRGQEGC